MDEFSFYSDAGMEGDDQIGVTTAVEQTTGSKNSLFSGIGRGISVPMYQWLIVVGAVVALWLLGRGLGKALTS